MEVTKYVIVYGNNEYKFFSNFTKVRKGRVPYDVYLNFAQKPCLGTVITVSSAGVDELQTEVKDQGFRSAVFGDLKKADRTLRSVLGF